MCKPINILAGWMFAVWAGVMAWSPSMAAAAENSLSVQAFTGQPFGVAKIAFDVPKSDKPFSFTDGDFQIVQKEGRVLYPAYTEHRPQWYGETAPKRETAEFYFLFRGEEPFDVIFHTPEANTITVRPKSSGKGQAELRNEWWQAFQSRTSFRSGDEADVPPIVDNYLASMLSRRLKLDYQRPYYGWGWGDGVEQTFGLLTGAESVRAAMQKDRMLNTKEFALKADRPLPKGVAPPALELPRTPADVAIEPMAAHVPHEAFYFRFGSFENFQWFRATLDEWGSDLRNLTSVRGVDYGAGPRVEQQLALKETAISKIFGPQVIGDVAIVGFDTFLREGSSLGIIFQAKNNLVLGASLTQQRADALTKPGVKEENVKIAGREVSLLSTPDNRVRSFYVVDGDFHLVTNSKTLVRRFLEAGAGEASLAKADEFRVARMMFPLTRNDSAFIYLSDEFFRHLVGPKYRVEMTRRMQALTDIELIELAKLAAKAERVPGETVEQLVAASLLPERFGTRVDGSRAIPDGERYVDSLRGARGSFLPTADVEIEKVTRAEADGYAEFAQMYRSQWERVDPVAVGIQRKPGEKGAAVISNTAKSNTETIVLDIHIAPFAKQRYGMLSGFLGANTKKAIAPLPDDLIALQVAARYWGDNSDMGRGILFAGLRDYAPEFVVRNGYALPKNEQQELATARWYLGGTKGGLIQWLYGQEEYSFDAQGFAKVRDVGTQEAWVAKTPEHYIFSGQRKLLESVMPQVKWIDAERPAQLRLHIGDLSNTKLAPFVHAQTYLRALRTSQGNARLLHELSLQFPVAREESRSVAEKLLDAKLVCSLGGEYKFTRRERLPGKWASTLAVVVRDGETLKLPAGYQPPPMNWFRGLDLEFGLGATALDARLELTVERKGK